jgi:hypothetical protein
MGGFASPFGAGFTPPGAQGSPEAGPQSPDASGLLGMMPQQEAPDPQERLQAVMRRYRDLEQTVLALVGEFPEAGPASRVVIEGIRKMMAASVAAPGPGSEPPAPRTLA